MSPRWDFVELADRLHALLAAAENDLRLEQAVYGLDRRDERQLHELLAGGLSKFYAVTREVHYPSTCGRKLQMSVESSSGNMGTARSGK